VEVAESRDGEDGEVWHRLNPGPTPVGVYPEQDRDLNRYINSTGDYSVEEGW
jgi:hypothetical protein